MRHRAFLIVLVLVAGALSFPADPAVATSNDRGVRDPESLEERGPIAIRGNAEFTPENGVRSGEGTLADPYVIRGWRIVGLANYGVLIRNTTASWVVEDVLVDGEMGAAFRDAFWIVNVTGGMLRHVEARNMPRYGIYLGEAHGTHVVESAVRLNGFVGLYAHRSTDLLWERNVANANFKHGFYLANQSTNNRITLSESFDHVGTGTNSFGIYSGIGADHNVFDNNTLHDNVRGIQINLVSHNTIRDNTVIGSVDSGIVILRSNDTLVAGNVVTANGERGVVLGQSERVTVEHNDIRDHTRWGIDAYELGGHLIRHNLVRANDVGIQLSAGATANLVYNNFFSNPTNAADLDGGNLWNVSKQAGVNIIGGLFLGGNYWSDITDEYHDHDEDGLAESHGPYAVGIRAGGDHLPLVGASGAPIASFHLSNSRPFSFERVNFTDMSLAGDAPIVNHTWEFHDGRREYTPNVSREYERPGSYTVTLRVRDSVGLTASFVARVLVQNIPPVPRLAGPSVIATTGAVTLDASASTDADGEITAYDWSFGDGSVASGMTVTHAYTNEGSYSGSLIVVDDRLGSRALGFSVIVDRRAPSTDIVFDGEPGNAGWHRGALGRLVASDDRAGVERSEWRFADAPAWTLFDAPFELPEGTSAIRYRSVDRAGNVEAERGASARVDSVPPTTTYEGPALVAASTPITLRATDATSGPARTFYELPGETGARIYTGPFTLQNVAEGPVTITTWSEDVAGNDETPRDVNVTLDRTPPYLAIVSPAAFSVGDMGNVAIVVGRTIIRVEATDAITFVARVRVSVHDVVLFDNATGFETVNWTVPPGSPSEVEIKVNAWDAVGNEAIATRRVLAIPLTPPTLSMTA